MLSSASDFNTGIKTIYFLPQYIQLLSQSEEAEYFLEEFPIQNKEFLSLIQLADENLCGFLSQSEDTAQILCSVLTSNKDFVKNFNKIPILREELLTFG